MGVSSMLNIAIIRLSDLYKSNNNDCNIVIANLKKLERVANLYNVFFKSMEAIPDIKSGDIDTKDKYLCIICGDKGIHCHVADQEKINVLKEALNTTNSRGVYVDTVEDNIHNDWRTMYWAIEKAYNKAHYDSLDNSLNRPSRNGGKRIIKPDISS